MWLHDQCFLGAPKEASNQNNFKINTFSAAAM